MDESPAYEFRKAYPRPPKQASYACKRMDVDTVVTDLGIEPPFHKLYFGSWAIPEPARGGPIPPAFEMASARELYHLDRTDWNGYRRVTWWLSIELVPRELTGPIRNELQREGLSRLLRWLDERRALPDTAFGRNHTLRVMYSVADATLHYRLADSSAGKDP